LSQPRSGPPGGRSGSPRAQLPLLDRLMDADPGAEELQAQTAPEALERLHAAVRRDLEALLNARRRRRPLPALLSELPSSIINYGIPDPVSGAYSVPELRVALAREIELTIRRFEPRLMQVSVSIVGEDDWLGGTLRMKVDGVLRADPVPEAVSFETLLEPVTRDVTVRET
jgi:type VI secretion system protein ImpF